MPMHKAEHIIIVMNSIMYIHEKLGRRTTKLCSQQSEPVIIRFAALRLACNRLAQLIGKNLLCNVPSLIFLLCLCNISFFDSSEGSVAVEGVYMVSDFIYCECESYEQDYIPVNAPSTGGSLPPSAFVTHSMTSNPVGHQNTGSSESPPFQL